LEEGYVSVTGVEIAVKKILSPLRKSHVSVGKSHCEKQNGCASEDGDEVENGLTYDSAGGKSGSLTPDQLCLTEEKGSSGTPIDDNYVRNSPMLRVGLTWTDKERELYDISYLEDLPEVCKSGFTAKKTRQESVSLFSCLEAFLREEPLGPDDMW